MTYNPSVGGGGAHSASHTNGTDDIQDATAAQKGLATAAQITKLDGIATGANNYSHPNHTGDVTSTGDGATAIANDAVTYAKMQNVSAASRLLGRGDSGSGDPEELTLGSGLSMTGTVLSASGGGDASFLSGAITTTSESVLNTYTAITGSDVTVTAGRTYAISWRLSTYSAASTTGLRLRRVLGGGAVGTVHGWHTRGHSNATAQIAHSSREGTVDPFLGTGNATSTTSAKGTSWVDCLFVCTTSGTLGLEMSTEVNASAATVDGDGSYWTAIVRAT